MAIIELRKLRAKGDKEKALANVIGRLQATGKLSRIISDKGYVCYDTKEYATYKKTVKQGRPTKGGVPIAEIKKQQESNNK